MGKRIEENNAHPERRCVKDDGISRVSTITAQAEWMEVWNFVQTVNNERLLHEEHLSPETGWIIRRVALA